MHPFASNSDLQIRYRVVQALTHLGGADAKSILEAPSDDQVEAVANEAKKYLQSS